LAQSTANDDEHGENSAVEALIDYLACAGVEHPRDSAGALINEFGSVGRVLTGSSSRLARIVGPQITALIQASNKLVQSSLFESLKMGPVLAGRPQLIEFLRLQLGSLPHERVLALYLDHQLRLAHMARISDGSVISASADISRIIHLALDLGATNIVVVHNHPSGDPTPSRSDLNWTSRLARVAADLDLRLLDHIIVTAGKYRSIMHFDLECSDGL
jgi:DNA repair protein RadC